MNLNHSSSSSPAEEHLASPSASPSASHSGASSPLMSTLSRLSLSTSRPSVPQEAPEGYASRTLRFVGRSGRETLRRTGLAGLWSSSDLGESSKAPLLATSEPDSPSSFRTSRVSLLDTTHILYPTLTQHPDPASYPILALSLGLANQAAATVGHDRVFELLLSRLEPWVGEEGEGGYVLVVFAADGERRVPGKAWWAWRWRRIPRKYRKNLKRLYIVHPSLFTRTLLPLLLPFLSPNSFHKLHPLPSLLTLYHTHHVPLRGLEPTPEVLLEESRILRERPDLHPVASRREAWRDEAHHAQRRDASWTGTVRGVVGAAGSYLTLPRWGGPLELEKEVPVQGRRGYWGRSTEELVSEGNEKVPKLLVNLRKAILGQCTAAEGVFRRTSNSHLIPALLALLDIPPADQPTLPWSEMASEDPLLPPKMLLRFLSELAEPLIPPELYSNVRQTKGVTMLREGLLPALSPPARLVLEYIIHTLHHLSTHEAITRMSPLALAIVLAPSLIRGPDPLDDGELCLEPGKVLPSALRIAAKTPGGDGEREAERRRGNTLVGVLEMWIREYPAVSKDEPSGDAQPCRCAWTQGGEVVSPAIVQNGQMEKQQEDVTREKGRRRSSVRHELLGRSGSGAASPGKASRSSGKEGLAQQDGADDVDEL